MTTTNLSFHLFDVSELASALNWLDGHFSEAGADPDVNAQLKHLLDSQVSHLFHQHAHEPKRVEMHVELELDRGHVRLRLIDNGQPYNPLGNGNGGSPGRPLIRQLSDEQSYYRLSEHNILELIRHFPAR